MIKPEQRPEDPTERPRLDDKQLLNVLVAFEKMGAAAAEFVSVVNSSMSEWWNGIHPDDKKRLLEMVEEEKANRG